MKRLLLIAAVLALAAARPELYKESEDFQYSRSSSDDGSKSGYYGAQRGNMGGNYERAHNMDGLAQHQMSTAVKQVEGELGDATKSRTGSVFTAANSGGMYGSGHYDLSNLQGRNFQENGHEGAETHSSLSSHQGYIGHSAHHNAGYNSQYRTGHSGYQGMSHGQDHQRSNLQAVEGASNDNYNYGQAMSHSSGYHSQSGYQSQSAYDSSSQHQLHSASAAQPHSRLISTTPVRIYGRPGQRVAVPVGVQTYDATHSASTLDQNAIDAGDAEVFNAEKGTPYRPTSNGKHYESAYSYRKQWEKHDVKPEVIALSIPTENPFPKNSELYDDSHAATNQYQASGYNAHSGYSSSQHNAYNANVKTASVGAQSHHQSGASSLHTNLGANSHSDAQTHGAYHSGAAHNTNALGDIDTKPKSYQSSYSYHKAWERQGDPYEIKPVGGVYDNQASQRLTAGSSSQGYSSQHHGSQYHQNHQGYNHGALVECDCDENGNVRVARSLGSRHEPRGDIGPQASSGWDNSDLQQVQKPQWARVEDFNEQSQNKWDKVEDLGQHTQKQTAAQFEDFGKQSQNKWDDLRQQTQNARDNLRLQTQNNWDNLRQQSQSGWDEMGRQTENDWNQYRQQTENSWKAQRTRRSQPKPEEDFLPLQDNVENFWVGLGGPKRFLNSWDFVVVKDPFGFEVLPHESGRVSSQFTDDYIDSDKIAEPINYKEEANPVWENSAYDPQDAKYNRHYYFGNTYIEDDRTEREIDFEKPSQTRRSGSLNITDIMKSIAPTRRALSTPTPSNTNFTIVPKNFFQKFLTLDHNIEEDDNDDLVFDNLDFIHNLKSEYEKRNNEHISNMTPNLTININVDKLQVYNETSLILSLPISPIKQINRTKNGTNLNWSSLNIPAFHTLTNNFDITNSAPISSRGSAVKFNAEPLILSENFGLRQETLPEMTNNLNEQSSDPIPDTISKKRCTDKNVSQDNKDYKMKSDKHQIPHNIVNKDEEHKHKLELCKHILKIVTPKTVHVPSGFIKNKVNKKKGTDTKLKQKSKNIIKNSSKKGTINKTTESKDIKPVHIKNNLIQLFEAKNKKKQIKANYKAKSGANTNKSNTTFKVQRKITHGSYDDLIHRLNVQVNYINQIIQKQ